MTAWPFSRASAPLSKLLATLGLCAVAAFSLPAMADGMRHALEAGLAMIWGIYLLQLLRAIRFRHDSKAEASVATMAVDLAAVIVPLSGVLAGVGEHDWSLFCGIWVLKLIQDSAAFLTAKVLANEARNLLGVMSLF